jgi:vacuolar protein sorting-associated protein 13A/C
LERTNIDFQVQNSIVPSVFNIARFKVSGKLPSLQVNVSDTKYKSLMRLIDVCIPKFDDDGDQVDIRVPRKTVSAPFQLPHPFFRQGDGEYHIEDDHIEERGEFSGDPSSSREEQFFEADDGSVNVCCLIIAI